MSDLPTFGLVQQMNARRVSGEELEVLGKQASARWGNGEYKTLSEAVVETVKHGHFSPEQVKRVIEFANTDAFLREFKKEATEHKYIDFGPGQLADPGEILRDLNDGGGGSVSDDGLGDYNSPPKEKTAMEKIAGSDGEAELAALFGAEPESYPFSDPMAPVVELRDKLAAAHQHIGDQISGLEMMYADLADGFYSKVKQAALNGTELGEIVQALTEVAPSTEHMKVAFQLITPRLLREGVFHSADHVEDSLQKTAGEKIVNHEHPMLVDFDEFCQVLSKLAHLRRGLEEAEYCVGGMNRLIKEAAAHPGGWMGMAGDFLKNKAAPMVGKGARTVLGNDSRIADLAELGTSHAHHIAAAALANQLLGGRPTTVLNSYMPWDSQEKQVRQAYGVGALL